MNITIIGCGYVGLTTGVALAYLKHNVIGIDKDLNKIMLLKQRKSPIHERGLEILLQETPKWIEFQSDINQAAADADVIIIAVGTPAKKNGEADTSSVEEAARDIAFGLKENRSYTVVVKSTVPIGSNRRVETVINRVLNSRGISAEVSIASNPEFLREGMALSDTFYPDRIVAGSESEKAIEVLRKMYQPILEQTFNPPSFLPRPEHYNLPPLVTTNPASAEMIKYAANAFLALKISYINEIGGLCEKVGADVTEVARGIGLDPRIGARFLNAGIGWGGSCFPKDTSALLALGTEYNYSMSIVEASRNVNLRQRQIVLEKLQTQLKVLRGRTIGILGLAFKPDTDDVRESPVLEIIKLLIERGANVRVHDPVALANAQKVLAGFEIDYFDDPYTVAAGCDALILITEWDYYRNLDFIKLKTEMKIPFLLDGRNFLNPSELKNAGFIYEGIGR